MAAIIEAVFSVFGLIVTLLVVTVWLRRRVPRGNARRAFVGIVAAYVLASLYGVPYGVSRLLTAGFHPLTASDAGPGRTVVVVLGAGEWAVEDWDHGTIPVTSAVGAARVLEAFRIYRLFPDAWVISSGGIATSQRGAPPSGAVMRDMLVHLGVPPPRILVEDTSRSTHDEAVLIAPMLRDLRPDRVILVTSDVHMRRALGAFRAAGVVATPAIARDPYVPRGWLGTVYPSGYGLDFTGDVLHELVGIPYYAARGWWR